MRAWDLFIAGAGPLAALVLGSATAAAQYGQPPPPGYGQPPPPGYGQPPPPGYGQPPPPGYGQPPPQGYGQQPGYGGYNDPYGGSTPPPPPPPPPRKEDDGFEMPDFSVRIDPLNWLLEGRLGFELEVGLWEFISFELVPVFVVNEEPPAFNLRGREDTVSQHSNGIGAMSGASFGLGFWLQGEPFEGNVLRVVLTNYGYTYKATDDQGQFDEVSHTERQLLFMFGSHHKWGFFTLAFAFGLGVELNKQERCYDTAGNLTESGCDGELQIAASRDRRTILDLNSPFHPVQLTGRISLGFVF
jgi:hypothetical protein